MDVRELFRGVVIIVDDKVNSEGKESEDDILKIKHNLIEANFPVVCYEQIPDEEVIDSFKDVAFIILDWDFTNAFAEPETMVAAPELKNEKQLEVVNFINATIEKVFVPVFLFTGLNVEEVRESLLEKGLDDSIAVSRIFIKSKTDVLSEETLLASIEEWVKQMPSVYALKELDQQIQKTKNKMFLEWYEYSPQWTTVIWNLIKQDVKKGDKEEAKHEEEADACQQEFGEFLMRNLVNRLPFYKFDETFFQLPSKPTSEELKNILEYERYIKYDNPREPNQAYTGDLFKRGGKYFLNLRAQCDLSRKSDEVTLYLIKGEKTNAREIITEDIKITNEGELKLFGENYNLAEVMDWCNKEHKNEDEEKIAQGNLEDLNSKLKKYKDQNFYRRGTILEKANEVIIACVNRGEIIKFKTEIMMDSFSNMAQYRIGRILPPYITQIQQKCSQRMVHEGTLPIPEEIFDE